MSSGRALIQQHTARDGERKGPPGWSKARQLSKSTSVNKNKPPISGRNLAGRHDKAEQKSGDLSDVGMLTSTCPQSIHIGLFLLNTVVMQIHYHQDHNTILGSLNSSALYNTKGLGILKLGK